MTQRTFSTFYLADQLFGLDIHLVREINKHLDLTDVPHAPDYVQGIMNLRGQVITVLDLKRRLGMAPVSGFEDRHNVILKTDVELAELLRHETLEDLFAVSDKVGLLVDNIGEVVSVGAGEIDQPPANVGLLDRRFLAGVVKLNGQLLTLLDTRAVLSQEEA